MRNGIFVLLAFFAVAMGSTNVLADQGGCQLTQQQLAIEDVLFDESDYPWEVTAQSSSTQASFDNWPPIDCLCSEGCCINNLCWVEAGPFPFPQVFLFPCGAPGF